MCEEETIGLKRAMNVVAVVLAVAGSGLILFSGSRAPAAEPGWVPLNAVIAEKVSADASSAAGVPGKSGAADASSAAGVPGKSGAADASSAAGVPGKSGAADASSVAGVPGKSGAADASSVAGVSR
jgi:hypothetical protein